MPINPTKQVALTQNASVLVLAANSMRKCVGFANIDANTIQYLSNIPSDINQGWPIMPRAEIIFSDQTDKIDPTQAWYCYTTGAAQVINIIEAFYEPAAPVPTKTVQTGKIVPGRV